MYSQKEESTLEQLIPAVEMKNICKSFGSVKANNGVNLTINKGEILEILGENGSGKTTLMNMLSGIYFPDEGEIYINGKEAAIYSPKDAYELGIGMVHQHFKLVDVLTAAENIVLGLEGKLDIKNASQKIKDICDKYGFDVDPNKKIYNMSVSEKQTVEIVKVLYRGAQILILDEPTAVLTPQETEKLFAVMRNMKNDGKSIAIITHKLNEVQEISDRVAVLRAGEYVGDMITANTNPQEMTNMMVGRPVELNIRRTDTVDPKPRIQVRGLTIKDAEGTVKLDNVSFTANSGEVLGVAGISGCGQKELLEAIAGLQVVESGSISYVNNNGETEELIGKDPLKIKALGIALSFVPEDRLGMGLVGDMDIGNNMMLRTYRDSKGIFTNRKDPYRIANHMVDFLEIVTPSVQTPVRRLSGGNVQKVLVGREISNAPTVLLTAYATRGLDINSSYMIYDLINEQKQRGVSVIYVGEDLDVLVALCDRVLVLCGGKVSGIVDGRKTDKRELGAMMTKLGGISNE